MMKPTPTTCIATSFGMPNRLAASGIKSREPPATPDAPQALTADRMLRIRAVPKSIGIPSVLTAAKVRTEIVTAAPAILMVAPSGMETEYVSLSSPRSSQSVMFTGMFAAELLVKKAVMPHHVQAMVSFYSSWKWSIR